MPLVETTREGDVAVVTLSRPGKLNALSSELERELASAIASTLVASAAAVVIEGAGRAFSAGADMGEMRDADVASILAYYAETGEVYEHVARLPQPTVAALHGYCLGGGFELALACDFRVADPGSVLGLPEVPIGIVPSSGGTVRLVRAVGPARAKEVLMRGGRLSAPEAHRLGLITIVAAEGEVRREALALAAELAALPPLAVRIAKQAVDAAAESSREAGLLVERLAYAALAQTEEHRRATGSFGREDARGDA